MHICFIDSAFTWPPVGGANVDFLNIVQRISRHHRCTVLQPVFQFAGRTRTMWSANDGTTALTDAGIAVVRIPVPWYRYAPELIARQLRAHFSRLAPDIIWLGDMYFLKPWLAELLAPFPVIMRFYAYEGLCPNYNERFHGDTGTRCTNHLLADAAICRACFFRRLRTDHTRDLFKFEYAVCRVFWSGYAGLFRRALQRAAAVIVSNDTMRTMLQPHTRQVEIIPGGFSPEIFRPQSRLPDPARPLSILCAGRLADPAKGLQVLLAACDQIVAGGRQLQVRLAGDLPPATNRPYLTSLGWLDGPAFARALQDSDVFVAPSLWDEPFGLTVIEAMACGIPVIASANAGHRSTLGAITPDLLYAPTASDELAARLTELADQPGRRRALGQRVADFAAEHYPWDTVVTRHYLPLLNGLGPQ